MIVCNLTKPESTLDQVRKAYPKLVQTDAAQLAIALIESGKFAFAHYDEVAYSYPEDVNGLTKALSVELHQIQVAAEPPKKLTKAAQATFDEEQIEVKIGLSCNMAIGEKMLGDREDLKSLLGEVVGSGVEFQYGPTDVLWQWALDRANWNTVSGGDLTRRVRLKSNFQDSSVGVDLGSVTGRRKANKAAINKAAADEAAAEAERAVINTEESIPED